MPFAVEGLAPVDGWAVAAIVAKAAGYAVALLAAGGVLYLAVFPETPEGVRRRVRRWTVAAAALGLLVLLARFGLRSARISGMGFGGAIDPMMLGLVWDSPLGNSAIVRTVGHAGILAILLPGAIARWIAVMGAGAVATSYAFVGHSLGDPRWALGTLLVLHLLAAAFWIGALVPLRSLAGAGGADGQIGNWAGSWARRWAGNWAGSWADDRAEGRDGAADTRHRAMILHRFGRIATWTVGALVIVGLAYGWLLSGSLAALVATAYGWTLLAKVGIVGLLLGLAALNKLRLVPALAEGRPGAGAALRCAPRSPGRWRPSPSSCC